MPAGSKRRGQKTAYYYKNDNDNNSISVEFYEKELESYLTNNSVQSGLLIRKHGDVTGGYDSTVLLQENNDYESFIHPGEEICGLGAKGNISIKYVSLSGEGEEAIAKVEVYIEGVEPTPSPEPTPTPSPSPSPSPSPTPTPTPTPTLCEATTISVDPKLLKLLRKKLVAK